MTPPTGIMTINNTDISDLGLNVLDLSEWWSAPRMIRQHSSPSNLLGTNPATTVTVAPRRIPLQFMLESDVVADRVGLLDEVVRQTRGLLQVVVGDDTTRVGDAVMEGLEVDALFRESSWTHGNLRITPELVFYDPIKYELSTPPVSIPANVRVTLPVGTAPSRPVLTIFGANTNILVNLRPFGGAVSESMTFTGISLTASEALEIDMGALTIVKISSGTRTDALSELDAGWFFEIDPADEPTLDCDSNAVLSNTRRWLT